MRSSLKVLLIATAAVCIFSSDATKSHAQLTPTANNFSSIADSPDSVQVELGTIGLAPEDLDDQILAINGTGATILNATELQRKLTFGTYVNLDILNMSDHLGGIDMRFSYWGINSMVAEKTISDGQVITIFFNGVPAVPPSTFNYFLSSNLYSSEWNLRFMGQSNFRPLIGFRFFKVEDTYDAFQFVGTTGRNGFFSTSNSLMLGGQVGFEGDIPLGRFVKIFSFAKYGFLGNAVEVSTAVSDVTTGNSVQNSVGDDTFANLFEGGLGLDWNFAGPLHFRAGYHTVFASKVASVLDQSVSISALGSPADAVTYSSQMWHGVNFSAIVRF